MGMLPGSPLAMVRNGLLAAAVACICGALPGCATQAVPRGVVISDVTIISPERKVPLEHAYVRIMDGKITHVSRRALRGEQEIDGAGRFLIPGLIDSHVHLAMPPGFPSAMTARQAAAHPQVVATALAQEPRSYLFFGFTTVVDLFGTAQRTAQWNAQQWRPDAHYCGGAVVFDGQLRLIPVPRFSYDATRPEWSARPVDASREMLESAVARMAESGAICVKTLYEQGFTPTTLEEARALVAAAHAHKLPLFFHANRRRTQEFAIAAGADVIVHSMFSDPQEDPVLDAPARGVLTQVQRRNIGYQPTIQAAVGLLDALDGAYLKRPELVDAYPAALIDWYSSEESAVGAPPWLSQIGVEPRAWLRANIDRISEITRVLARSKANLIFGSDTPSDSIHTNPPGLSGRLEMNNWIAAGVSKEKLFRAMTIDNARALGLEGQIGTVEVGKVANLLLLRVNPLQGVEAYDTIEMVLLHGRPIPRVELSARHAK